MYEAKNFDSLLGLKGFSDHLLKTHFKLYEGYVANTNKIIESLKKTEAGTPQHSELKRRFGWEFNGMRLHELYFGNLSKQKLLLNKDSEVAKKLEQNFGSIEAWEKNFRTIASMRGIGWVILYYDPFQNMLFNTWVNEHDLGHLSGCKPLLVLDVFEHAFITDYGLNRAEYINSFFSAINWAAVNERL